MMDLRMFGLFSLAAVGNDVVSSPALSANCAGHCVVDKDS